MVIAVAIFWGFAWPDILVIKKINEDRAKILADLKTVKDKQVTIGQVKDKIVSDADGAKIVNEYLPKEKTEERIIDNISYAAGNANLSLTNMSVAPAQAKVASISPVAIISPETGQPVPAKVDPILKTSAKASVSGEYDKIRMFLDNIQKISIYNTIKSVSISKKIDTTAGKEAIVNDSILTAEVAVDFGYMEPIKVSSQKFDDALDGNTITVLRKYISQKAQPLGVVGGEKGKTNPFLAN